MTTQFDTIHVIFKVHGPNVLCIEVMYKTNEIMTRLKLGARRRINQMS